MFRLLVKSRSRVWLAAALILMVLLVPAVAVGRRGEREQAKAPRVDAGKGGDLEGFRKGEERRRARRQTAAARDERRRSRTAFRRQSRGEALRTGRQKHPELVERPLFDPLPLEADQKVDRYIGSFGARIRDGSGKRHVVDSTLPLRSDVGTGTQAPVDVGLTDRGDVLEPKNPLVRTRVGKRLADGVRFPGHERVAGNGESPADDLAVRLDSPGSAATADVVEGRAFFADAMADTDLIVAPSPRGTSLALQVRSADAPEKAAFAVDLPVGAQLALVPDDASADPDDPPPGAATIKRGDETLATIQPPMAWDAEGEPVATHYSVSGNQLVVHYPHRSADLSYPLAVDPQVERFRLDDSGNVNPNGPGFLLGDGIANFGFQSSSYSYPGAFHAYPAGYSGYFNAAIGIYSDGTSPYGGPVYDPSSYGQWVWRAPRQSFIVRADFNEVSFTATGDSTPRAMCAREGIFSVQNFNWEAGGYYTRPPAGPGQPQYPSPWIGGPAPDGSCTSQTNTSKSHFAPNPTPGNMMIYGMFAYGGPAARLHESSTAMQGANVTLDDRDSPTVSSAATSPGGWVRSANITTTVNTRDPGLGMYATALFVPIESGTGRTQLTGLANCPRVSACPEYYNQTFTYNTEDVLPDDPNNPYSPGIQRMPEGVNTIDGDAYDILYKPTHFTSPTTVKIDRSGPDAEISGIGEGELVRDRNYQITAGSTDRYSGSKTIAIKLDGQEKARRDDCPANNSRCTLDWTLNGGDPGLTEGEHTLTVDTSDQLGNNGTAVTRKFRVERTAPTIDAEGSLWPPEGPWVDSGPQDLLFDASDNGTGVVHASLEVDDQTVDSVDQPCEPGGCDLSRDFSADTSALSEGQHAVVVVARDGAGNITRTERDIRLERSAPSLSLSGSLNDVDGQPVEAGTTYNLHALATDGAGVAEQSGLGSISMSVDGDTVKTVEQGCEMRGCGQSADFEFVADDYESGSHTITVTATDLGGNATTRSLVVGTPDDSPPSCPQLPPATPLVDAAPIAPSLAEEIARASVPSALEASSSVTLVDHVIRPALTASEPPDFVGNGSLTDLSLSRDPSVGVLTSVHTLDQPNCVKPAAVGSNPSMPELVGTDAAAFYANEAPATDLVLRPTATGVASVLQARNALAPPAYSWNVGLQPGQELKQLPGGAAAIVEPAEDGTAAPDSGDAVSAEPSRAEREQALSNTSLEMSQASDDLERAQRGNPDRIVAVFPPPWAKDATGNKVATSFSVSGLTLTMHLARDVSVAYPVSAGYQYTTRDAVDEYETLATADSIPDAAFDETAVADPAPTEDPPPPPSGQALGSSPDDEEGVDGLGSSDDATPEVADNGTPQRAESSRALTGSGLSRIKAGLTAADPATITNPNYAGPVDPNNPKLAPLNPDAVRPFAPWRTLKMAANDPKAAQWREWAAAAKGKRRGDLTITRDQLVGKGATVNFTTRQFREELTRFLKVYGGSSGVIDNLMAWNEPNYNGTGKDGNRGDPLKNNPVKAAQLWIQAVKACFPSASVTRCGHYEGSSFKRGQVVAGEFVEADRGGKYRDREGRSRRRRVAYSSAYHAEILRMRKNLRPRVWSFHDYSDFRAFELRKGREQTRASVLKHYADKFKASSYDYSDSNGDHESRAWLTEGGASYTFHCERLDKKSTADIFNSGSYCGGNRDRVLLLGMGKQRSALAFIFKAIATRHPNVSRLYYFNFKSKRAKCNSKLKLGTFRCDLDERGLIGTEDDPTYRQKATSADSTPVVPKGGGSGDYSSEDDRRLAFCILRDRKLSEVKKPTRLTRTQCPARGAQ